MTMTNTSDEPTATIRLAGYVITAHADLAIAAGWTVHVDGTARDGTSNGYLVRRLLRAIFETEAESGHPVPLGLLSDRIARAVLGKAIVLGEVEATEGRRLNSRTAVAKMELEAAKISAEAAIESRKAAEITLAATQAA
jgi:hypothetical protein